jgi:dTMP kinase
MRIIAFEGLDASGKQTQTDMLVQNLRGRGFHVCWDSFPRYEFPIGELIGKWLRGEIDLSPEAAHMLYEADRQDFMRHIESLSDCGFDYMILDRFSFSNLAFGMARGFDMEWMLSLQSGYRQPDATIILDINSQTSFARKGEGRDRNELDTALLQRARAAYSYLPDHQLADRDIYTINANTSAEEVHRAVMELFDNGFL